MENALWAYLTAYKSPIDMSPFWLVYGKACHLPFELEHKAWWAIKLLNMSMENVGEKRCLQLSELEELRLESFENSRIFKEKMKKVARQKNSTQGAKGGSKGVFLQLKIEVILGQAKESLDGSLHVH